MSWLRKKPKIYSLSSIIAVLIILIATWGTAFGKPRNRLKEIPPSSQRFLQKLNKALSDLTEYVKPAVVNISTVKTIYIKRSPAMPFFGDPRSDPFFRKFFEPRFPRSSPRQRKARSLGSGVIMTQDGYILTNSHVVRGADDITVKLYNNKKYKGRVIASDTKTDLAVIKIKAKDLHTLKIGDSSKINVGEMVIAIGNPYGLNQSVTTGIVSAMGRHNVGIADYEDFIQTDAAINPGNSGGALVNIKGELIGINTAIFSTSGGYQGIGFAIPSNMAKRIMNSLITKGKVIRGWIGIQIQELSPKIAKHFNLKEESGVLISQILENSPADKAGLIRGDIIIKYDNKKITNTRILRNHAASTEPGKKVKIIVLRNGKKIELSLKTGEFPDQKFIASKAVQNKLRGLTVRDLNLQVRSNFNIPAKVKGVIITDVDIKSPAFNILRRNDVLLELNKKNIRDINNYKKLVSSLSKDEDVLVLIYRPGVSKMTGGYIYLSF